MSQDLIDKLKDIGISERTAKFALSRTNNNVQQAAEYVFSGRADRDEVSDPSTPTSPTLHDENAFGIEKQVTLDETTASHTDLSSSLQLSAATWTQGPPSSPPLTLCRRLSLLKRFKSSAPDGSTFVVDTAVQQPHDNVGNEGVALENEGIPIRLESETEQGCDSPPAVVPPLDLCPIPLSIPPSTSVVLTQDNNFCSPLDSPIIQPPMTMPEPLGSLSSPVVSPPTPLARQFVTLPDPEWFDKQSDAMIMAALGRRDSRPSSRPSSPAPGAKPSPTVSITPKHTATGGALAALGLRAAALAAPTITPPTPADTQPPAGLATGSIKTASTASNDSPNPSFLRPSRPVGRLSIAGGSSRSRSTSPFWKARKSGEARRARDKSPEVGALRKDSLTDHSDAESPSSEPKTFRPAVHAFEPMDDHSANATEDEPSEPEHEDEDDEDDADSIWDDDDFFDETTRENTEANALYEDSSIISDPSSPNGEEDRPHEDRENFDVYGEDIAQDALGEGPNVVVPEEPLFNVGSHRDGKRKVCKSGLEMITSRPVYGRDRCTITITQGDPDAALDLSEKRMKRYLVLSDLSEESRYAVEWAIGTVCRDGDELFFISVMENEDKVDPKHWGSKDQQQKLKVQKERQTTALVLTRQVTGLLQRTRLNLTVTCQSLHSKNARHMLLDLIDFLEPTLVIVGSRGLGQLKGILLGSTSHYLVQKSSVPVMVARRHLHRAPRHTDPEKLRHSPRVSIASAKIEKTAPSRQEDDIVDIAEAERAAEMADHEAEEASALAAAANATNPTTRLDANEP